MAAVAWSPLLDTLVPARARLDDSVGLRGDAGRLVHRGDRAAALRHPWPAANGRRSLTGAGGDDAPDPGHVRLRLHGLRFGVSDLRAASHSPWAVWLARLRVAGRFAETRTPASHWRCARASAVREVGHMDLPLLLALLLLFALTLYVVLDGFALGVGGLLFVQCDLRVRDRMVFATTP